ncbi:MAG: hypothetical protein HYW48_02535 [Deltaproteobacteria bacterium]|nr:hypothetical protein [Deltaproteobacteria bacterium]
MDEEHCTLKLLQLLKFIKELSRKEFWGQVTIRFKNGEPIIIQQEQQIKL